MEANTHELGTKQVKDKAIADTQFFYPKANGTAQKAVLAINNDNDES